jgi:DNA-binding transcriptional MerR regulator
MDGCVAQPVGERGELCADAEGNPWRHGAPHPVGGYRGPAACQIVGITYRQLDYWARTGLVTPTVRGAKGSGDQRLYGFADLLVLKVVKRLLQAGVSLQSVRAAVEHLRAHAVDDLAEVTLLSDGVTTYQCRSSDEIAELLRGGRAVFGVALGAAMAEISDTVRHFRAESASLPSLRSIPTRRSTETGVDVCHGRAG